MRRATAPAFPRCRAVDRLRVRPAGQATPLSSPAPPRREWWGDPTSTNKQQLTTPPPPPFTRLRFRFDERYPLEPPEVTFIPPAVPVHPHIFSCGHLCVDLLYVHSGGAYSPALTVAKLCLAIRSMLASATVKERPPGDAEYGKRVAATGKGPKSTAWLFEDDQV